jgi:aminoglycoside phosphotransferase (APT) family kinase protein
MTAPVWAADIAIDAALASRLVADQFPALGGQSVEPFGVGWDNAAFLVAGKVVFRFPRRRIVADLIEREIALLPYLAPRLPIAISAPTFVGAESTIYPWSFAGYPLIAGRSAGSRPLADPERSALAQPLARFLRALHSIDPTTPVALGLPPDELKRFDHDVCLRRTDERLPTLASAGYNDGLADFAAWLQAHRPVALDDAKRTVVHGDFYPRHVVLDANGRIAGVIDWGDLHLGDPAIDLAIAHLMLPAAAHQTFRNAYGLIDNRTWTMARYRAIYSAILLLDYGIRESDAEMVEIGSAALRLMRDHVA